MFLYWLLLILSLSVDASNPSTTVDLPNSIHRLLHKYIVELSGDVTGLPVKPVLSVVPVHERFYQYMRTLDIPFNVIYEYKTAEIFLGASIQIKDPEDVGRIRDIPGVKAIYSVAHISRPQAAVVKRDPEGFRQLYQNASSTHIMTGVDKLHSQGIFGEGVKIGIIDSGVDYRHPALGGAIGAGNKIIGGYDFCGDHFDGDQQPAVPDEDPLDTCFGHGTHIAGVIGANPNNKFGISGVAPNASIAAYRVLGCQGATTDDIIIRAMDRAYNDGMDILVLSLGWAIGWSSSASDVAASRIAEQGRIVVIAAGNDGKQGTWYSASPSAGVNVISVGSVNNVVIPSFNASVIGVEHPPILYPGATPINASGALPVYATSNDTTVQNDACLPLPDDAPDLSAYVVVVRLANCPVETQMRNVAQKGAKTILLYDPDGGPLFIEERGNITARLIPAADGKFLVERYAAGIPVKLNFSVEGDIGYAHDDIGGLMSSFTSYGPTYDMYMKPTLAAPGGLILSTFPINKGGFSVTSGTSAAAPFVAGAAALILQARGKTKEVALSMRDLLQSTSIGVPSSKGEGSLLQTVAQQGSGLIQADRAANTKTLVTPAQILLNDTAHFASYHEVTITNTASKPISYHLSHAAAGTVLTLQPNSYLVSKGPVELLSAPASITIEPSELTIAPGTSQTVTLSFSPPKDVEVSRLPVFSGFIKITSPYETLQITYLGAVGDLKQQTVIDRTDKYGAELPYLSTSDSDDPVDHRVLKTFSMNDTDLPKIVYRLSFGSSLVIFDLCTTKQHPADQSYLSWSTLLGDDVIEIRTLGLLQNFTYLPRSPEIADEYTSSLSEFTVDRTTFAKLTQGANGDYRIMMRALKVTGDSSDPSHFESWLSPPFAVNYTA